MLAAKSGITGTGKLVLATVVLDELAVATLRSPTALANTNSTNTTNIMNLFIGTPESFRNGGILCGLVPSRGKSLGPVPKQYTPLYPWV